MKLTESILNRKHVFEVTAGDKKHFENLIKEYRNSGMFLVTYGKRLAELEDPEQTEFIIIHY